MYICKKIFKVMLNRRILRIKAFKILFSSYISSDRSLKIALEELETSCQATRDLYLYMLSVISPLTNIAKERIESAKNRINPTEEEKNPNTKFIDNLLTKFFEEDIDFTKIIQKKKFSWDAYDLYLRKTLTTIMERDYFKKYMASETCSLKEDCKLFIKIFEDEFVDSPELEQILEEQSIYWNDDLAYALTQVCTSIKEVGKSNSWSLPLLYQSEAKLSKARANGEIISVDDDKAFVNKLLSAGFVNYDKYRDMVAEAVPSWDKDRMIGTDLSLIILGLSEVVTFPEIPIKVSLNEYVGISMFYGGANSKSFVNGLLDRLVKKFEEEGVFTKVGRGLL